MNAKLLKTEKSNIYMFALTSPTSGSRSVGIVRLRTKATEYSIYVHLT
jgi:hypothetical protein